MLDCNLIRTVVDFLFHQTLCDDLMLRIYVHVQTKPLRPSPDKSHTAYTSTFALDTFM